MAQTRVGLFTPPFSSKNGFTLVEILVGTGLFMVVGMAGYRIFTKSTQTATAVQQQTKFNRSQTQFLATFQHQIENTIQMPNAKDTALQLTVPVNCLGSTDPTEMGWGIAPYPGYDMAAINAMPPFDPIDPSLAVVNDTDKANDAVTLVYQPEDSAINYISWVNPDHPELGPVTTVQTTPTSSIQLDTSDGLAKGDFAIISDSTNRDLIRITGIILGPPIRIQHSYTASVWNKQMTRKFGGTQNSDLGRPMLYKVKIVTYALDSTNHNLMVDDHIADDQFVGAPSPTFGTPGLAYNWQVVAPDITQFQLHYIMMDGTDKRTPQMTDPSVMHPSCGSDNADQCGCNNQLGRPDLRTIRADFEYLAPSLDKSKGTTIAKQSMQSFDPIFLKSDLPTEDTTIGCIPAEGVVLYSTNSDGSPNTICNSDTNPDSRCFCSDRPCTSNCYSGGGSGSGSSGYGGGGSG